MLSFEGPVSNICFKLIPQLKIDFEVPITSSSLTSVVASWQEIQSGTSEEF